ncbi:MAG: 4-(cytidine 5'-diphospho)-2-C-methyl-D-erythritol kinase [Betaproteobacteria bacterium]|nr:4-(cytidine 5'-diphospho)-2-C-methyl-D-erythritol kinase [Betaproteobacteria bacterium]
MLLPAPAKINRHLHVLGRRPDGYHLLESLFVLIGFGDSIALEPRADGRVHLLQPLPGVPKETDLCWRAATVLQEHTGCRRGADIGLAKRLPQGGGLGGGSSDAATVLIGLNRLWGTRLKRRELLQLGLRLGADVPFFIGGENALVTGIGERLRPMTVPRAWYLVLVPGVAVPTAEIFADPDLTRSGLSRKITVFSEAYGKNDLQAVAMRRYPQIASCLAWLSTFGDARMTGSGGCVFVVFAREAEARLAWAEKPPAWQGFLAPGLPRHPLACWVED